MKTSTHACRLENSSLSRRLGLPAGAVLTGFLLLVSPSAVRANVYPTNVRLHSVGSPPPSLAGLAGQGVLLTRDRSLQIDYRLNEEATGGVLVEVLAGTNVVRHISLSGGVGTMTGANSVLWDGTDDAGSNVLAGAYSVRVTASANGFTDWTETTDPGNAFNYVYEGRGIAVNRNPNSPYYGRIFVANSQTGAAPDTTPGDRLGVQKFNADGSPAEEGVFSDGGWAWGGNFLGPWKLEVSDDDFVYVNDWSGNGLVLRFDQRISPDSSLQVLRPDNRPNSGNANLSGPFITGTGTNTQIWMADTTFPGSVGIRRWTVSTNGALATNDLGTTIIQAAINLDLSLYPYDVALDSQRHIYTIQQRFSTGSSFNRVFRYPAYNESGTPETVADWKIGSMDDTMLGAMGVAVNPAGTLVAASFVGNTPVTTATTARTGGSVRVFSTADGSSVATPTSNITESYHYFPDVAWDNAGNLYTLDDWSGMWRVYSPPGTNSATTPAVQTIQLVNSLASPLLSAPALDTNTFTFTLTGLETITYVIEVSTNLSTWQPVATNQSPNSVRSISVPAPAANRAFFRARVVF